MNATKKLYACWLLFSLGLTCLAPAFPTWIGVYGDDVRHDDPQNPGTFTILMNQDYFGLHARVVVRAGGGSWVTNEMSYVGNKDGNSRWQFTPGVPYQAGTAVHYYFHGYDDWGGHIWDDNGTAYYTFAIPLPPTLFSPLVQDVSEVTASGAPGPLFALSDAWMPIVAGDDDSSFPSHFVLARTNGAGRVVAFGSDGMIGAIHSLDNALFLEHVVTWLDTAQRKTVAYTTGHGEWVQDFSALAANMSTGGTSFSALSGSLTTNQLAPYGVLVVGNAWQAFTSNEVDAVNQFVLGGGGLCLLGLGWSWETYHPAQTMDDYPMTALARPHELRWSRLFLTDPTDQHDGSPRFHTFYPNIDSWTSARAMETIHQIHAAYPSGLPGVLESNETVRVPFVKAHQFLMLPTVELPEEHTEREPIFAFCSLVATSHPAFYGRAQPFNMVAQPTAAWCRERFWRTWRDSLPLTLERRSLMMTNGQMTGRARDIFNEWGIVLLDNVTLDAAQLEFIHAYLSVVPASLHHLRSISVVDYLGEQPAILTLDGQPGAVNIFGMPIGGPYVENSFPAEVAPGLISTFCVVVAHEVNHVVDAYAITASPALSGRKADLLLAAGTAHTNYLRSMFSDGFFASAPQEFFASIANEWFADSAKTLELGLTRFDQGAREPLNQALFFADVYSCDSNRTHFYTINTNGLITQSSSWISRDNDGRITNLYVGNTRYAFAYNTQSQVTAYSIAPNADFNTNTVPDAWEIEYFNGLQYVTGSSDWDGDGMPDADEFIAGTHPRNAASFFQTLPGTALDGTKLQLISWPSLTGRVYSVYGSTNLMSGSLTPLAVHLPSTPPVNTWTVQVEHARNFYRIAAQMEP